MNRTVEFIEETRAKEPVHSSAQHDFIRFCHADHHKGAALAELALIDVPRENISPPRSSCFDISMLMVRSRPCYSSGKRDRGSEGGSKAGGWCEGEHGAASWGFVSQRKSKVEE